MTRNGILTIIFFLTGYASFPQLRDEAFNAGEALFQTNCGACHSVHHEIIGPQLASITKKRSEEWLVPFIQNSQSVIASHDEYAVFLFEGYHHQVMPSFRHLKKEQIQSILHYIELESKIPSDNIVSDLDIDQHTSPDVFHGQTIYEQQCASCHFLDHEGSYGPSLGSVTKRHPPEWLYSFIKNSQRVIAGGDPYAVQLFNRFEHREMVAMEFLKDDDIRDILEYIEYRSSSDHPTAGAAGRTDQFSRTFSEIHSTTSEKPLRGGTIVGDVVVILLVTGFSIYGIIITRLFKYLK